MKRKRKKTKVRSRRRVESRKNGGRESLRADLSANLYKYFEKSPALRRQFLKEVLNHRTLCQKIAQRVAEELT